jgi:hypothetical protein
MGYTEKCPNLRQRGDAGNSRMRAANQALDVAPLDAARTSQRAGF